MHSVFFFRQKTADELRISDWSSDVCSSDLARFDDEPDLGQVGADVGRLALADEAESGAKGEIARMHERLAETFVGRFIFERAFAGARDVDIGADAEFVRTRPFWRQLRPEDDAGALFAVLRVGRHRDHRERDDEQGGKLMAFGHAKSLLFRMKFPAAAFRSSYQALNSLVIPAFAGMRERMTGERRQTGDQPLASSPSSAPGSGWPIASSSLSSTAGAPAPLAPESAITGWPLSASSSADKAAINSSSSVSILFNATITGLSVRSAP